MQTRVLIPELMDDPNLGRTEHIKALRGLRRINAWTRNAALVWKQVAAIAVQTGSRPLRVLDVATGAADIPIALAKTSALRGVDLKIDACDISEQALTFAIENCIAADVEIQLFRHDILHEDTLEQYDIVMCSQFLHHLTNEEASTVLKRMKSAASRRVIVVDLERSRMNWLQVWFATRTLSRSKVVHFDGPQSVRAAFTVDEFASLVESVGFHTYSIRRHWPCRFVFIGETDGPS